jgi:Astacin (Peptidase family M12A)
MAKKKKPVAGGKSGVPAERKFTYCSMPMVKERVFSPDVNPNRARLIRMNDQKWVNGTKLHYCFFTKPADWVTKEAEKDVVRKAFKMWMNLGVGIVFEEVNSLDEAEIRIGFLRGDGAWSYIGRDILNIGRDERTMNFGWDLTSHPREIDTAIHEIGHSLGFPHEHQNPHAGIVWDEEAVYASLGAPPNSWDRQTTFHNIISKINPDSVQGSAWDPDSVMHYPFGPGLIKEPAKYRGGLEPAGGISARDQEWVKTFYPPIKKSDVQALEPFGPVQLTVKPGQQLNFSIAPKATRRYEIGTFGTSDTVMVLFEDVNGELRYVTGDDDSGQDTNARISIKLFKSKRYVLRLRLYYAARSGDTAVMMW